MAKDIFDKLASALKNGRSTTTVYRETLAECEATLPQQEALAKKLEAEACDPTLNQSERDEAHEGAQRAKRQADTLRSGIERLNTLIAEREESETAKAAENERKAALAERDELAELFKVEWLDPMDAKVAILERIIANVQRMDAAGIKGEPDAEAIARGVPAHFYDGNAPIDRFTKMKIPASSGPGRQWPVDRRAEEIRRNLAMAEDARIKRLAEQRKAEAEAARKAAEEAKFGTYSLSIWGSAVPFEFLPKGQARPKTIRIMREPYQAEMRHTDADRARALGCNVELIEAGAA